jgi:hypothetical protein
LRGLENPSENPWTFARSASNMAGAVKLAPGATVGFLLFGHTDSSGQSVCRPLLTQESDVVESHILGRRARQIVEAVYRVNGASLADVRRALPDPRTHSACLDRPAMPRATMGRFAGAGSTLQDSGASRLTPEDLEGIKTRIEHAEARS